jgi:hypothetical protein
MDAVSTQSLSNLIIARRLLTYARENDPTKKSSHSKSQSAKEAMEEDQAILSGKMPGEVDSSSSGSQGDDIRVCLRDLIKQLTALRGKTGTGDQAAQPVTMEATTVEVSTHIEQEFSMQYTSLERVEGLVVRNPHLAETDRYAFEFQDGATLKITDKWSGKSTTIWGDPHVDVSDVDGDRDGDFQDLKESNSQTTFMLTDGTRLTISAMDNGVIQAVDIYKGDQHVTGVGSGSIMFNDKNGLFSTKVQNGSSASSTVAMGDVVYAGGDGNDWFNAAHQLIWGKTTGPTITARPSSVLTMQYRYMMQQTVSINHVAVNS